MRGRSSQVSSGARRLAERLPWRSSDWTARGILTAPPDVKSRTKLTRLFRVCGGLFAVACLYQVFLLPYNGSRSLWIFAALFAITFGPEVVLARLLPDRNYPVADGLFAIVPWAFVAGMAVQALSAVLAVWVGSFRGWVFLYVATVFVCLCPREFCRLRMLICYVAAAICFAVAPRASIRYHNLPENVAWNASFLAFMMGSLSHRVRDRDRAEPENVPPRPMQ